VHRGSCPSASLRACAAPGRWRQRWAQVFGEECWLSFFRGPLLQQAPVGLLTRAMSLIVPAAKLSSLQAHGASLQVAAMSPGMLPGAAAAPCRPAMVAAASYCPAAPAVGNAPAAGLRMPGEMLRMRLVPAQPLPNVATMPAAAGAPLLQGLATVGAPVRRQRQAQSISREAHLPLRPSPHLASTRSLPLDDSLKNICSISTASTDTSFALNLSRLVDDGEALSATPSLPGAEDAISNFLQNIGVPGTGNATPAGAETPSLPGTPPSPDDTVSCYSIDAFLAEGDLAASLGLTPRDTFPRWRRFRLLSESAPARTPRGEPAAAAFVLQAKPLESVDVLERWKRTEADGGELSKAVTPPTPPSGQDTTGCISL